jgi:large subunit ribosomal protein L18
VPRLTVLRTGQHLYAQVFTADGSKVLAAATPCKPMWATV